MRLAAHEIPRDVPGRRSPGIQQATAKKFRHYGPLFNLLSNTFATRARKHSETAAMNDII